MPECTSLATDITTCQSKGKIITLSLGGATGSVGFTGDAQAETFAQTIWDDYFEGTSSTRPFGSAVLDGIDLDIESGSSSYTAFLTKFRSLASGGSKKFVLIQHFLRTQGANSALGTTYQELHNVYSRLCPFSISRRSVAHYMVKGCRTRCYAQCCRLRHGLRSILFVICILLRRNT